MHPRATELIAQLALAPHPEGGHYRETWRSALRVQTTDGRERAALTDIYYLLTAGSFSVWHRVCSDEVWHWYEGEPLELLVAAPDLAEHRRIVLGPAAASAGPAFTVPAHWWQAARPLGEYALCGCTVAPGFDFEDFSFLRDDARATAALRARAPLLAALL